MTLLKISLVTKKLDRVINVVGYLHNAEHWPEKVYVRLQPARSPGSIAEL